MKTFLNSWPAVLAFIAGFTLISGCTFFRTQQPLAKVGVQYATMKFVEQASPGTDREVRIARITSVAKDLKAYVTGESVTLDTLKTEALKLLERYHPSPADKLLAVNLIDAVTAELAARVSEGTLASADRVLIGDVLDWIAEAASLSGE